MLRNYEKLCKSFSGMCWEALKGFYACLLSMPPSWPHWTNIMMSTVCQTLCLVDMTGPRSVAQGGHRHSKFPHNVASFKMELCSQWWGSTRQKRWILLMGIKRDFTEKGAFGLGFLLGLSRSSLGDREGRPIQAGTVAKQKHWAREEPGWFGEWRQQRINERKD